MIIKVTRTNQRLGQPKPQTSTISERPVRIVKQGTHNIQHDAPTTQTIQTIAQLTSEWVDPILNRERPTKQQILAQLGGGTI